MEDIKKLAGERIAVARKKIGLSQSQLAEKMYSAENNADICISQSTISAWERGASFPPIDRLYTLAKILQCNISYLLGESDAVNMSELQISEYIGLKEESIRVLHSFVGDKKYLRVAKFLDSLISSKYFHYICVLFEGHEEDVRKFRNANSSYKKYVERRNEYPVATKEEYKELLAHQCKESEFKFLLELSKWLGE